MGSPPANSQLKASQMSDDILRNGNPDGLDRRGVDSTRASL